MEKLTEAELVKLEEEWDAIEMNEEVWTQEDLDRRDEIVKVLDSYGRI